MAYDHFFKRLMRELLQSCEVQPEDQVGDMPLKIDLVARCKGNGKKATPVTIFGDKISKTNIFEYKSSHDNPKKNDLSKLVGYVGLYCNNNTISIDEMRRDITAWYVTAKHPRFIDELVGNDTIGRTGIPGLYSLSIPSLFPYYILVIDDLEIKAEFFPLLLLAPDKKLRKAFVEMARDKEHLGPELEKYLRTFYLVKYEYVKNMTEIQDLLPEEVKKNIRMFVEDVGIDNFIETIGLEKLEKRINELKKKKKE
ncbi:MAG: hypothetical protein ACFFCS_05200 [Candidatus Hodarchaeota archaeon]